MSLKDNFNQAVKEILRKDGLVGEDLSKESKKRSELDKYIDPPKQTDQFEQPAEPAADTAEYDVSAPSDAADSFSSAEQRTAEASGSPMSDPMGNPFARSSAPPPSGSSPFAARQPYENASRSMPSGTFPQQGGGDPFGRTGSADPFARTPYGGGNVPPVPPSPPAPNAFMGGMGGGNDAPYYETEETTIISRNTIVNGSIRSFANVNVDGSIKGDVKITKNISVTGKIVGDIECNNSVMAGASMQGNVASKGQVQLDRDTILLGDISAQYLDLNGKVKGNLDIGGKAEFKTDAVVLGNITASTITVLDGATIQGFVNTTFLSENSENIFPEAIAVTE